MPTRNPLRWLKEWADWFEQRGVYVPGEESPAASSWRGFGWILLAWLIGLAMFIVFFAFAV